MYNNYTELDLNKNDVKTNSKTICYIYRKCEYMLHNDMAKRLFAIAIECVREWEENNNGRYNPLGLQKGKIELD